jgi:hypothetical protein
MTPTERIAEIIADRKQRRELRRLKRHRSNEIDEAIRKARELGPRFPDESDFDHARRFGLLGERRGGRLLGCAWCSDLPHRRPERGPCHGCGKHFAPEMIEKVIPEARSNAGAALDHALGVIGITHGKPHARKRKDRAA